jgi:hypothetical protein
MRIRWRKTQQSATAQKKESISKRRRREDGGYLLSMRWYAEPSLGLSQSS